MSNNGETMEKELNDILGYGKKFKIIVGVNSDNNEPLIKEYHMCPVSLKDLPELQKSLNTFFESAGKMGNTWNDESIRQAGNLIVLSLKKMHPKIDIDEVINVFGLGGLAKAVKIEIGRASCRERV